MFTVPASATGGLYRVILTATDTSNRQASVSATLLPANPPASWASYYPLRADAADANGHYDGTLKGGASIVNDPVRGNVLNLSGTNQYVALPPGIAGMQTFMAWVEWNGGAAWQRIFDFGNDTTHYTVLTPSANSGKLRFNISLNGIPGEQIIDAPSALPIGVWTHVAVTMDGNSVVLYTNGTPVGTNRYANVVPANFNPTNNCLGKSNWPDPYFSGRISSVRIFSRALAASEITAPQIDIAQPVPGSLYSPGAAIAFTGSARDFYDASILATGLTWTVTFANAGTTNIVLGPVSGVGSGTFVVPSSGAAATNGFYQFILLATDTTNRQATKAVNVFPASAAAATNWSAFYSFSTGAQDASNTLNGTLQGGASILNVPPRGNVLNLSGAGQYVRLPAAAASGQTVSGWVNWHGGNAWQRILDFGQDSHRWFFFAPLDSAGLAQCAITTDISAYNRVIESPAPFPQNQWTHFALVMDGCQGILYLNGNAVAVNNSVNLLPSDMTALNCYFGKSQYATDPYLNGQLDSVALNSFPLSAEQLLPGFFEGTLTATNEGGQLVLSWPQTAAGMKLYTQLQPYVGGHVAPAHRSSRERQWSPEPRPPHDKQPPILPSAVALNPPGWCSPPDTSGTIPRWALAAPPRWRSLFATTKCWSWIRIRFRLSRLIHRPPLRSSRLRASTCTCCCPARTTISRSSD